ncbi:toxin-antitoxin system YwqK family antitoxin [Paracrocinitomix mangrovi]|uniref:toxin-antitoxin system YwqK family antitoxin n=1 Tax=Paracrocinitomix mangrovi TaxID=2862509 RepID=UPI001C8CF8E8|nr:toxin-antitoxin system YwqK family antitoxin [Paracrocinitomix mangrovi]UKN02773.1 toxin-antitoxin system YwqK family antitoxin [Paracrocinitomix mangrovi]
MRHITAIVTILLMSNLSFGQDGFKTIDQSAQKKENEPPKCRDLRFRIVPNCVETVYPDEDQGGAMMHKKSGKPFTGSCIMCHYNGNLEMFLTFQGGFAVGVDTVWYENGNLQLIRSHDVNGTGKENGTWKLYRANGSLKWEKTYVMGAENGESRYYYPDSSLQKIETWNMGELDGRKQEFYPNGTLKKEIMYGNGDWNGKYITYFDNGLVESEQQFEKGKKTGLSKYYYDNGELLYEENHENGCLEGESRRFYPKDKRIWTVENYSKGIRDGVFEEYYNSEKNTIKFKGVYKKGSLVEEHYFDEFGEETEKPESAKNPFLTKQEQDDVKNWPEYPTDDFLKEKGVDRKTYDKARKNYMKKKSKQKENPANLTGC